MSAGGHTNSLYTRSAVVGAAHRRKRGFRLAVRARVASLRSNGQTSFERLRGMAPLYPRAWALRRIVSVGLQAVQRIGRPAWAVESPSWVFVAGSDGGGAAIYDNALHNISRIG